MSGPGVDIQRPDLADVKRRRRLQEMTEFRIALRSLLRSPASTLAAVATLTLAGFAQHRPGEGNRHVFF
jgi:hypothetical protein